MVDDKSVIKTDTIHSIFLFFSYIDEYTVDDKDGNVTKECTCETEYRIRLTRNRTEPNRKEPKRSRHFREGIVTFLLSHFYYWYWYVQGKEPTTPYH